MRFILFLFICANTFLLHTCKAKEAPNAGIVTDTGYVFGRASENGTGKFYKGREIAKVVGEGSTEWMERSERFEEEAPDAAVAEMTLQPNSVVADIGAGTGYFSFRIAKKIPQGKVYAEEIQNKMISLLEQKKSALKDSVTEINKGTDRSPNLPSNSIDLALMVDVYHELAYPKEILHALYEALRPGGKLLLIEYRGEDSALPIKSLHKTTIRQLSKEMNANRFVLSEDKEFLPTQHFLLYSKQ